MRFRRFKQSCIAAFTILIPAGTASAQVPPDGAWIVRGPAPVGNQCSAWFVGLAVENGQLGAGVVGIDLGNINMQNLVLNPDGSFSGNTAAGFVNYQYVRPYTVVGQFTGDMVTLTLKSIICNDRTGSAMRQPLGLETHP